MLLFASLLAAVVLNSGTGLLLSRQEWQSRGPSFDELIPKDLSSALDDVPLPAFEDAYVEEQEIRNKQDALAYAKQTLRDIRDRWEKLDKADETKKQ